MINKRILHKWEEIEKLLNYALLVRVIINILKAGLSSIRAIEKYQTNDFPLSVFHMTIVVVEICPKDLPIF